MAGRHFDLSVCRFLLDGWQLIWYTFFGGDDALERIDYHAFSGDNGTLVPIAFGQRCCDGNFVRPYEYMRDQFVLHYVAAGRGIFQKGEHSYSLREGQVLLSRPGEVLSFSADPTEGLRYVWIRFVGSRAERLPESPDVFRIDGTPFLRMTGYDVNDGALSDLVTAELYRIIALLCRESETERDPVAVIRAYLYLHPTGAVSVGELSRLVGLSRQHLSTLFHRRTGQTLTDFISEICLARARALLAEGLSVGECATLAGYASIYAFSKAFRRRFGVPPSTLGKADSARKTK
jgi:AraC-like DNA-binding protein